jgi:hypothetical protein
MGHRVVLTAIVNNGGCPSSKKNGGCPFFVLKKNGGCPY